jgi:hypothetical protein
LKQLAKLKLEPLIKWHSPIAEGDEKMDINWNNVLNIRVKENMYGCFMRKARYFDSSLKSKYIKKIGVIDQVFSNYIAIRGRKGAYPAEWFYPLKIAVKRKINEYIEQKYRKGEGVRWNDTHNQSTNYILTDEDDPFIAYDAMKYGGEWIICHKDEACLSGLTDEIRNSIEHGAEWMDGWYTPNPALDTALIEEYIGLCEKNLSPFLDFMYDGEVVHYNIPLNENMNFRLLYFTICFPRFLLEYHGSISMTMKLIKERDMNFFLAHVLSFHYQRNKRWLHVPWSTKNVLNEDLETLVKYAKAIHCFSKEEMYGDYGSNFRSSDYVSRLYSGMQELDINCSTMSAIKQMNKYVEG